MTIADALKIIQANSYEIYLNTMILRAHPTGNTTIRSIGEIARYQTVKDDDAPQTCRASFAPTISTWPSHLARVADKAKDNVTSGPIDAWTDEAERRAWFLFEISH